MQEQACGVGYCFPPGTSERAHCWPWHGQFYWTHILFHGMRISNQKRNSITLHHHIYQHAWIWTHMPLLLLQWINCPGPLEANPSTFAWDPFPFQLLKVATLATGLPSSVSPTFLSSLELCYPIQQPPTHATVWINHNPIKCKMESLNHTGRISIALHSHMQLVVTESDSTDVNNWTFLPTETSVGQHCSRRLFPSTNSIL